MVAPTDFRFVPGDEYLDLPSADQTWVIEPLIPAGGLVNVYGQPKEAKKSWMAINMALAITNGWDMFMSKFPIRTWGPVAYLQVDTPRSLWKPRWDLVRHGGNDISSIYMGDPELVPYPLDLSNPELGHTDTLESMVTAAFGNETPVVVFIDTLREVHGSDENDSTAMRNVIANLRRAFMGSALVLISHSRKGGGENGLQRDKDADADLMGENRGSGYVAGRMDTIIRLTPKYMTYQGRAVGRERFKIEWDEATGLFHAAFDPAQDRARELLENNVEGKSERELARALASDLHLDDEAARSTLRRIAKDFKGRKLNER